MTQEDGWKLMILRKYIWKMANSKSRYATSLSMRFMGLSLTSSRLFEEDTTLNHLNNIISLKEIGITPQTIFFDFTKVSPEELELVQQQSRTRPYSVAEALLDASRSIDDRERRGIERPRSRRVSNGTIRPRTVANPVLEGVIEEAPRSPGSSGASAVPTFALNGSSTEVSTLSDSPEDMPQISHALHHRSSMISLLNRGKDKATAETATFPATAFGEVDHPYESSQPASYASSLREPEKATFTRAEKYGQYRKLMWQALDLQDQDGRDPHVLQLLDNLFEENFPIEMLEFGPAIVSHSKRQPIKRSNGRPSGQIWRPDGNLVAHYGEHGGPCNRVVVAPDHAFFVTASDDGTVKVWDASRLEKNVATRCRQTHKHAPGAKVKSLCFIENHHCFVSAATDGSIHVVRVDYSVTQTSTKYGKLKIVKNYQLPAGEYVVWMEHYKAGQITFGDDI